MTGYNHATERGTRRTNIAPPPQGQTYGQSAQSGPAPTTAGHHKHDILNKLDPRVDSTHDHAPVGNNVPEGTYGPHKSRVANALDPRVDSDGDRTHHHHQQPAAMHGANHQGMMGSAGSGVPEGTYGPHSSRAANALDPRIDSDMDSSRRTAAAAAAGTGTGTGGAYGQSVNPMSGPGPATKTAGPHKSNLLNKLDPAVDSKAGIPPQPGAPGSGANMYSSGPGRY